MVHRLVSNLVVLIFLHVILHYMQVGQNFFVLLALVAVLSILVLYWLIVVLDVVFSRVVYFTRLLFLNNCMI